MTPRRPLRAVLVGVGLVGLVAGALLRSCERPPAAPEPLRTTASVGLAQVLLSPRPSVVLDLRMVNRGDVRQVAEAVSVSGGGVQSTQAALGLDLPVLQEGETTVTVPLRCGPRQRAGAPVQVLVRLRQAGSGPPQPPADLVAVPVGQVAAAGGLCSAADAALPIGWREPVSVTRWAMAGDQLAMQVTGLPGNVTEVLAAQADSWLLPWAGAPPLIHDRTAELHLDPPSPGCRDGGTRPVLPTGLQLVLPSPDGTRSVYAQVGAAFAQWLADAFVRSCPSLPDGPSAVRTDLGQ